MKTSLSAAVLGAVAQAFESEGVEQGHTRIAFIRYLAEQGKSFATLEEFMTRQTFFAQNDITIREHNNKDQKNFFLSHNAFSDWSDEELQALHGYEPVSFMANYEFATLDTSDLPRSVDWVAAGGVTRVKDQGHCGSCWAFGSCAALETANWTHAGELVSFSEQQLVDCDTVDAQGVNGSHGCSGGQSAFSYYMHNQAMTDKVYPYTAKKGACQYVAGPSAHAMVKQWYGIAKRDIDQLKAAVAINPVNTAVNADSPHFLFYKGGVLDDCDPWTLTHVVTIVGYGSEAGREYWLIKNSMGTGWGENGYAKIAIQEGKGVCGIQKSLPIYPASCTVQGDECV